MFCPRCRAEYVPGVETCEDCQIPLTHALPAEEPRTDWAELLVVSEETEAEMIRGFLQSAGVPCTLESLVFHAEPVTFGPMSKVRVHVPEERLEEARRLLADQLSGSTFTAVP